MCCSGRAAGDHRGDMPAAHVRRDSARRRWPSWSSFPPRLVPVSWGATAADRFAVMRRMLAPPFLPDDVKARHWRKLSTLKVLDWLEAAPGSDVAGALDVVGCWARGGGRLARPDAGRPGSGGGPVRAPAAGELITASAPGLLLARSAATSSAPGWAGCWHHFADQLLAGEMARTRDPGRNRRAPAALRKTGASGSPR